MTALLLVTSSHPSKSTLSALALAKSVSPVAVLVPGPVSEDVASLFAEHGAVEVYYTPQTHDPGGLAAYADAIVSEGGFDAVFALPSELTREAAARLAARRCLPLVTDVSDLDSLTCVQKRVFGGAETVTVELSTDLPVYILSPADYAPDLDPQPVVVTEAPSVELPPAPEVTGTADLEASSRPDLLDADIVVSGGRGVGGPEAFALVEELADAVGAAVGASRAATDAGWYPHKYQVGQTGTTVSPSVYVALGISGAIQHRAGMQTSKNIIAVNKDEEAPIFDMADIGVVADLFEVVPAVIDEVSKED